MKFLTAYLFFGGLALFLLFDWYVAVKDEIPTLSQLMDAWGKLPWIGLAIKSIYIVGAIILYFHLFNRLK